MTRDTWHIISDMWHLICDTGHIGYTKYICKLQVSSSDSLGKSVQWHVTCDTWHMTCDTFQVVSKCIIYPPDRFKTIWLVSMCSIITKNTSFLLKLNLHCNLPHFRNVSNISGEQGGKTTELICKCQFSKRQWKIIPFERGVFCKQACCAVCRADPSQCNSTSRQNPPIQQNRCNLWTNTAIKMPLKI